MVHKTYMYIEGYLQEIKTLQTFVILVILQKQTSLK